MTIMIARDIITSILSLWVSLKRSPDLAELSSSTGIPEPQLLIYLKSSDLSELVHNNQWNGDWHITVTSAGHRWFGDNAMIFPISGYGWPHFDDGYYATIPVGSFSERVLIHDGSVYYKDSKYSLAIMAVWQRIDKASRLPL